MELLNSGNLNTIIGTSGIIALSSTTAKNFVNDFSDFGITLTQVRAADFIIIQVLSSAINYTNGIIPVTSSIGIGIGLNEFYLIKGRTNIENFEMISQSGTANVQFTLMTYGIPVVA